MASSPPAIHLREPIRGDRPAPTPSSNNDRLSLPYLYGRWHVTHSTLPMWRGKQNVRITYSPYTHAPPTPPPSSPNYSTISPPAKTTLAERIARDEEIDLDRHRPRDEVHIENPPPRLGTILIDDLVEYQPLNSSRTLKVIRGTDMAIGGANEDDYAERLRMWQWRGRGLLFLLTSQWQILGFGEEPFRGGKDGKGKRPREEIEEELPEETNRWMVTFFEKTLFTPAGLDIYSRDSRGLSEELVGRIKETLGKLQDQEVSRLAGELFEVVMEYVGGGEEDA